MYTELAGQAEGRHAIHQAEIDCLGRAPLIGGDRIERHAEHFGRGRLVNVALLGEGAQQTDSSAGQVRHDAQLDLRVVRRDQRVAGGLR